MCVIVCVCVCVCVCVYVVCVVCVVHEGVCGVWFMNMIINLSECTHLIDWVISLCP